MYIQIYFARLHHENSYLLSCPYLETPFAPGECFNSITESPFSLQISGVLVCSLYELCSTHMKLKPCVLDEYSKEVRLVYSLCL